MKDLLTTLDLDREEGKPFHFVDRGGHPVTIYAPTREEAEQVHLAAMRAQGNEI